ncbi:MULTISPECIES: hypothetical protein [Clostridia]|uniref:hypothetical protein n=1 Tax=Clostridia TaxID=186801 RepID=UPI000EA2D2BD|nr:MULTISPECIES: hypothetical protein [Clostridia]NBJ68057.1 hypothetical protein [Roseburia sp. 1XD42-34]RKI82498.1 hypothetical protein D7V87_01015 [Clostridium sp. 1xD42-85]
MERYWKLIFISCLLVFGIGFFYLHHTFAEKEVPKYTWEKQAGNDEALEDVLMEGYVQGENYFSEEIQLAGEDRIYASQLSFFEKLNGVIKNPKIKELQQEYRGFMRGKAENTEIYFENENILAYADVKSESDSSQFGQGNFELEVEALYKKEDKTTSFSIKIPNQNDYDYMAVQDVMAINGKLYVVTQNDIYEGEDEYYTEWRLYTLHLKEEKLISEAKLFSNKGEDDSENEGGYLLQDPDQLSASKYIAIEVTKVVDGVSMVDIHLFDLETQEKLPVDVPKELLEQEVIAHMDAKKLYFIHEQEGKIKITPYQFVKQKVEEPFEIPISESINSSMTKYTKFINDKLYILYDMNSEMDGKNRLPLMYVIDLKEKKLFYQGKLKADNKEAENKYLSIYMMYENER